MKETKKLVEDYKKYGDINQNDISGMKNQSNRIVFWVVVLLFELEANFLNVPRVTHQVVNA
jgi:hypothetical protein